LKTVGDRTAISLRGGIVVERQMKAAATKRRTMSPTGGLGGVREGGRKRG
jgi:hypothetical protein